MKKYLFGLSAIVFALVFSAFTNRAEEFVVFVYQGSSYAPQDVEDLSLWEIESSPACNTPQHDIACTIILEEGDLDNPSAGTTLEAVAPSIEIVSEEGLEDDQYRVKELKRGMNDVPATINNGALPE